MCVHMNIRMWVVRALYVFTGICIPHIVFSGYQEMLNLPTMLEMTPTCHLVPEAENYSTVYMEYM